MKYLKRIAMVVVATIVLSSCGINMASVINHNQNATQVHLTENNYQIIDKVKGSAAVDYYILIFGGMNKKQLYENAYASMIDNANLDSGSKALINVFTEEHVGGFPPFYYTRTITVSAHVIEFTR